MLALYRNADIAVNGFPIPSPARLSGMETVGDRVRKARKELRWTQKDLAKKAKVAQSTISELETGPGGSTEIVKIALALKVSPYWLDNGKGQKKITELEAVFFDLSEGEQEAALALIRVVKGQRAT